MGAVDIVVFLEGLAEGMLNEYAVHLDACIDDATHIIEIVEEAFKLLGSGEDKSLLKRIMEAFQALGAAFKYVPDLVAECGQAGKDISATISKVILLFSNPTALVLDIAKNVFWHGIQISGDLWHAVIHFQNKNYKEAGRDIGDIIYQLILSRVHEKVQQ